MKIDSVLWDIVTVVLNKKCYLIMENCNAVKLTYCLDLTNLPDLLTLDEVIQVLRIPHISTSNDYKNVVKNLIRMRDLPRIKIGHKLLFPTKAVLDWIEKETIKDWT